MELKYCNFFADEVALNTREVEQEIQSWVGVGNRNIICGDFGRWATRTENFNVVSRLKFSSGADESDQSL